MKRFIGAALSAALALTLAVPAAAEENKIGDVVGHTYYTDITAQIDGHPLRSYNIGGETAVVAEDLREYGFSVAWDGEARTLTVERDLEGAVTGDYQPQGQTQTVGAQAGDIYYTDIKTYVQGEKVESFALNGETAIRFSELSRTGTVSWNGVSREAALTLIQPWTVEVDFDSKAAEDPNADAGDIQLTVRAICRDGAVAMSVQGSTGGLADVWMNQSGLSCSFYPSSLFLNRSYGASYDRLREIQPEPGPAEKTPEQLQEIAQVFQVRKNGRPVEGDLWFGKLTDGRPELYFDFNQAQGMQDGDELILYFGDVASLSGKEASQTGSSVLTEDPMEAALDELKADVEEWMAVTDGNSCWEVYPNEQGTLFVGHYSGTTRGSTTKMVQVSRTGEQVDLSGRLPGDLASDFAPRNIQTDETGRYITFYAVVRGRMDNGTGLADDSADYRFTFDVETGELTWEPVLPPEGPENPSGDPMVAKLNELKADVRNWIAVVGSVNSGWKEFPNARGVLFVAYYAGTPHGGSTEMVQVYDSGDVWYVSGMLPSYPAPYFAPRDIQVDETGRYVTFVTPVKEVLDYAAGTAKDYGDCRCVFDVEEKTIKWEPLTS